MERKALRAGSAFSQRRDEAVKSDDFANYSSSVSAEFNIPEMDVRFDFGARSQKKNAPPSQVFCASAVLSGEPATLAV